MNNQDKIEQGFQAADEFLCSGQILIDKPNYLGGRGPARWEGLVFDGTNLVAVVAADEQAEMHQKAEEIILAHLVALSEHLETHYRLRGGSVDLGMVTSEYFRRRLRNKAETFRVMERDSERITWRAHRVESYQLPSLNGYVSLDPHYHPELIFPEGE